MLRILIASPSKQLTQALAITLHNTANVMVAGLTETTAGTLVAARRMDFEVLILDAALPEAMSVWVQVRNEHPLIQVIVLADTPEQQEGWRTVGVQTILPREAPTQQLRAILLGALV